MTQAKNLLIVDDSRVSRMLIRRLVEAQRPDWKCTEVANGEEALRLALEMVFDYATVDVNMPGMDGMQLTEHFHAECPQLRSCLITANFQEETRRFAETYKTGLIRKPITEEGITNAISFLERSP
jgi:CheY-like chemotaxis protein